MTTGNEGELSPAGRGLLRVSPRAVQVCLPSDKEAVELSVSTSVGVYIYIISLAEACDLCGELGVAVAQQIASNKDQGSNNDR